MRGRIAWLFGVTDILARKALEQMLHSPPDRENRTMQGLYEQAFCGANIAFWAWEKSGDRSCFHSTYLYELLEMPEPPEPDTASDGIFEHPVRRVIHPDDLERYDSEISGGVLEYRVIVPNGTTKYLREHRHQARNDNGVVTWRYGTIQDITDQTIAARELNSRMELGRLLFDITTSSDETKSINATFLGCITKVCQYKNWAVGHIFVPVNDHSPEFVSSGIWYDNDPERFRVFRDLAKTVKREPGDSFIGRILTSGQPDWIEDIALDKSFIGAKTISETGIQSGFGVPVKCDGKIIAVAEFYTTETEFLSQEQLEILKHIAHVIGRIAARIENERKIEEARLDAERSSQAKSEFLSSMSHELRTPMNAILGFAQILKIHAHNNFTENQTIAVDHILQSGKQLMGLLNDVLELNKTETGKTSIHLEQIDAHGIIEESLSMVQDRADSKGITLLNESAEAPLPALWTDPSLAVQALVNLLSNAVKYNGINGKVFISCEAKDHTVLKILVSDTGPGIPLEQQDELFKPFIRLGRESGEIEGTGIGLTITRNIIELLGGKIGFESAPGYSSTFWLEFPIKGSKNQQQFQQELSRRTDR